MSFSRTYILGDSQSDTGALTLTTFGLTAGLAPDGALTFPPPALGYQGRFSDGPVTAEVLSGLLGAEIAEDAFALIPEAGVADLAAFALGIERPESSFAYGSARATGVRTLGEVADEAGLTPILQAALGGDPALLAAVLGFDINLGGQVARLSATLALAPPPEGALATIFVGLNDFQDFTPTNAFLAPFEGLALVGDILAATEGAARAAAAGGIETIALFTFPSAGFFPPVFGEALTPEEAALADLFTGAHALGIKATALELRFDGIDARVVDLGEMAAQVEADAAAFGFESLDVVSVLGTGTGGAPNPAAAGFEADELGFYDFIHFSGALHGVFGAFAARTLTGETAFLGNGGDLRFYGADDDLIFASGGNDAVFAGAGDDAVFGGRGDDGLFGGASDDLLAGGDGDDALFGGAGGDLLAGGRGNDASRGNGGADLLLALSGADLAHGGSGDDVVAVDLSGDVAGARLRGARGVDTLVVLGVDAAFGGDLDAALAAAGVSAKGFESVATSFDAALGAGDARLALLEEADLWGLV